MIPEELGGGGMTDVLTGCVVQEELCHGCSGIGNLVTSGGFFAEPVLALGTDAQKEELGAPAHRRDAADDRARDDRAERRLRRRRRSRRPRAASTAATSSTGRRRGSPTAASPSCTSCSPPSQRGSRHRGITAFLLHKDDEGISFGQPMRKMGQRAILNTELFLSDCFVADDRRLGEEGEGFRGLMEVFDRSRVTLSAAATGLARAALEYATQYAKEREQFGRPIAEHQAVAFRLADMALRVDASRLLDVARRAPARRRPHGDDRGGDGEAPRLRDRDVVHVGGGADARRDGYSREYPVEKWMRDAKLEEIEEGTSDIQRLVISRGVLRA